MAPIEWTDRTWNPIRGCSRVSEGCRNCYAESIAMSDLFHESLSDADIDQVFAVMAMTPQHTYQILTKRAERMHAYLSAAGRHDAIVAAMDMPAWMPSGRRFLRVPENWPMPNVHLGVSVEDQPNADIRIPLLLETQAAVRFISAEPLLGPVDLGLSSATCKCCPRWSSRWVSVPRPVMADFPTVLLPHWSGRSVVPGIQRAESNQHGALSVNGIGLRPSEFTPLPSLDWVIVGGESGAGARPFDVAWARSIVAQCKAAGVACFVKQLGADPYDGAWQSCDAAVCCVHEMSRLKLHDKKGGDPVEWPDDLRVRQFPEVASAS